MFQSYVLVWQEESLIQLLKNLRPHVNYVGNSYYLPSDKGYEKILCKLRGYKCVERLRTTRLNGSKECFYNIKILFHNMKILAFIQLKCGFYGNQPDGMKQIIWISFKIFWKIDCDYQQWRKWRFESWGENLPVA